MLIDVDARELRKARRQIVAQRTAEREAQGSNSPLRSGIRRFRRRIGTVLVEFLAPWLLRMISLTWRIKRIGPAGQQLFNSDKPWIGTMWHGRMLTLMPINLHCHRNIGVLVSPSSDGNLAKRALQRFRYRVVRGSLSKRGATAMREMHQLLQAGGQLVITPDGPRGPRHSINTGAAWLARATGAEIIPIAAATSSAWRLKSWDRMCIPKPFARVIIHYGDPVAIHRDASDETLESVSAELRTAIIAAEKASFESLQVENDLGSDA